MSEFHESLNTCVILIAFNVTTKRTFRVFGLETLNFYFILKYHLDISAGQFQTHHSLHTSN